MASGDMPLSSSKKAPKQGGNTTAPTQQPMTSESRVTKNAPSGTGVDQMLRGYTRSGVGGSKGTGNKVPQEGI